MFFCKKKWKMGVFFGKKSEKCFFCKKVDLSSTQGALGPYVQYQYFLFYILLIWGAYAPNAPPCLRACLANVFDSCPPRISAVARMSLSWRVESMLTYRAAAKLVVGPDVGPLGQSALGAGSSRMRRRVHLHADSRANDHVLGYQVSA